MFIADDSPARVLVTPQLRRRLEEVAASSQSDVTILLTDERALLLPGRQDLPHGTVHLGHVDDAGRISFFAVREGRTTWWRHRAIVDLTDGRIADSGSPSLSFQLTPLTEAEIHAAVASGPLPRY